MKKFLLSLIVMLCLSVASHAQSINPILKGFNPDPSICRAGEDYYICCSSFTWYPGLPIYHSRDLVNWELISYAIDRPGMVDFDGVLDKDGIWAPTIRYHEGKWYIFCNVSNGGNFYITADDVRGPWSDPVFLKDAPGVDPSIFWDDDGKAYITANVWGLKKSEYHSNIAIWIQEIDLDNGKLLGERHLISSGHAINAKHTESPHIYKIKGKYVLVVAEGGADENHAAAVMTAKNIFGPYSPQTVNPVLSQRHYGYKYPIQGIGHVDIVDTPNGDMYSVALGKRMIDGKYSFTRETFLCPVERQNGEFIFNPGEGGMTLDIPRPNLPQSPVEQLPDKDEFDGNEMLKYWCTNRIPKQEFHSLKDGKLTISLQPESIDSLVCPAMFMRKVREHNYTVSTHLTFSTKKANEAAGIVLHRNNTAYVALLRTKDGLSVIESGKTTATIPYTGKDVYLRITANGIKATLEYGTSADSMSKAAEVDLVPLTEHGKINRFNGLGTGVYATSNGKKSSNKAYFDYFEYRDI